MLTALFSCMLLALVLANGQARLHGGHNLAAVTVPALTLFLIGIGLFLHKKWSAALFFVLCAVGGIWVIVGSIVAVPMPWSILDMLLGSAMLVPCFVTVRYWGTLIR